VACTRLVPAPTPRSRGLATPRRVKDRAARARTPDRHGRRGRGAPRNARRTSTQIRYGRSGCSDQRAACGWDRPTRFRAITSLVQGRHPVAGGDRLRLLAEPAPPDRLLRPNLLLANSSWHPRVPMNTGTSQPLRTLRSGCLTRFGNTTWNTAQPRLWSGGHERVGAALGASAGRRPRDRPALARAVARRRRPSSARPRPGVGQGQRQAHRARGGHLAHGQRAQAGPLLPHPGRRGQPAAGDPRRRAARIGDQGAGAARRSRRWRGSGSSTASASAA
jgi:hypothetical protein